MAKFGFYDYNKAAVGTDGVIYKESLTSTPSSGYTKTGAGTNTFTSAGMTVDAAGTSGAKFSGISGQTALDVEGTIRFLISKGAFDSDTNPITASPENFLSVKVGTTLNFTKHQSNGTIKLKCSADLLGKSNDIAQWGYATTEGWDTINDLVECVITWDQCGVKVFIDRYKLFDVSWADTNTRPDFTEIYLGAIATAGGSYTHKNLLIADKKTVIKPSSHRSRIIHFYGDSYPQQGNYPQIDTSGRQRHFHYSPSDEAASPSFTEDGLNGTVFDNGAVANLDAGMVAQCHRKLTKKHLYTHKVRFWGEGSSGYVTNGVSGDDVEARVDIAINGNYDLPNVAVVVAGYNDAAAGEVAADIQTAAEGIIAALKATNSNIKIILATAPYNSINTGAGFLATLSEIQDVNTGITAAANGDSVVTLVDIYTLMGGASTSASYFAADDIHPSPAGHALYGNKIAEAIIAAV